MPSPGPVAALLPWQTVLPPTRTHCPTPPAQPPHEAAPGVTGCVSSLHRVRLSQLRAVRAHGPLRSSPCPKGTAPRHQGLRVLQGPEWHWWHGSSSRRRPGRLRCHHRTARPSGHVPRTDRASASPDAERSARRCRLGLRSPTRRPCHMVNAGACTHGHGWARTSAVQVVLHTLCLDVPDTARSRAGVTAGTRATLEPPALPAPIPTMPPHGATATIPATPLPLSPPCHCLCPHHDTATIPTVTLLPSPPLYCLCPHRDTAAVPSAS